MFELDGESSRDGGVLLGMSPVEVVVAVVLLVFIFDVVFDGGSLLSALLQAVGVR